MRSNSKPARITVLLSAAAGLLFSFQNCSGGFKDALDLTGQSTFSSSSAPDGIALYTTNCSQCHGDISVSIKQGRSASQISSAMINIGQMNFLKLSASEIDAISAALNNAISVTPIQIPTLPIGQVRVALNSNELNAPQAFRGVMMRRLTRQEISNVLMDVLNVDPVSLLGRLPTDIVDEALNPFDNDASTQSISSSVIESYESFAESYANLFLSSSAKINLLAGCTPSSASDLNCFNQFATRVGRLLLRREITAGDLLRYKALSDIAVAENNFYSGPRLLIQMFLQNPEFLYRIESGQAISGSLLRSLTDYEIANRMSFLIWGSAPDSALLDAAAAGQLKVELSRQAQAERLWASSKSRRHWNRFHAQWLGYEEVSLPSTLANDMRIETDQLIEKILFSSSNPYPWMEIFNHNQTYLSPALAQHYALGNLTAAGWVTYTAPRGGGLLSHGRFLAQGAKFGDTSPTLRGYRILKRALCQKFGPVPVGVDPDNPPAGSATSCKSSAYSMRHQPSCVACHALTDNIGFGLENFSPTGQWRNFEAGKPQCGITGDGAVGSELFAGPAELGQNLSKNPVVVQCAMRQLLRYSLGRADDANDQNLIEAMHSEFMKSQSLKNMVLSITRSPAFVHKQ